MVLVCWCMHSSFIMQLKFASRFQLNSQSQKCWPKDYITLILQRWSYLKHYFWELNGNIYFQWILQWSILKDRTFFTFFKPSNWFYSLFFFFLIYFYEAIIHRLCHYIYVHLDLLFLAGICSKSFHFSSVFHRRTVGL